jgi:coenzyme F420-reducing hydrogenase beta subunit
MIYPIVKVSQINTDGISRIDLFPYQQRFMYKLEEEKRIAISDVELIRISKFSIYVKGLDACKNSPVLDIKVAKKT